MATLPPRFVPVIVPFAGLFRQRTWRHARTLLVGAILAPGVRTVASDRRGTLRRERGTRRSNVRDAARQPRPV